MSVVGQQLISAIREIADAEHFFCYKEKLCVYIKDGCPSCLVGQGLWQLGLIGPDSQLRGFNENGIDSLLAHLDLDVDNNEVEWLEKVQSMQDAGNYWGLAVAQADRMVTL